jgi:hypothetical protein
MIDSGVDHQCPFCRVTFRLMVGHYDPPAPRTVRVEVGDQVKIRPNPDYRPPDPPEPLGCGCLTPQAPGPTTAPGKPERHTST